MFNERNPDTSFAELLPKDMPLIIISIFVGHSYLGNLEWITSARVKSTKFLFLDEMYCNYTDSIEVIVTCAMCYLLWMMAWISKYLAKQG